MERNISPDFFFNSLISDEDLSKLLCTCRGMKEMILKWKTIFPIQEYEINRSMTDKMIGNMVKHYSNNINKLSIPYNYFEPSLLTIDGYHFVALLRSNLFELSINNCLKGGLYSISHYLVNLTSLLISNSPSVSSKDLDSLSKLTNLEKIDLGLISHVDDVAVLNYSTLTKMKSIIVCECHGLSGLGLSYLIARKEFLVQLDIRYCHGISSEGFHCLNTLTNLTCLTITGINCMLDDIGINRICSSCLLIVYLCIRGSYLITVAGLNNINCLINLKALYLMFASDDWLAKLSHNTALTYLDLEKSTISDEELTQLSSLVDLAFVFINGKKKLIKRNF
jgi:hypothetical protein